MKKSNLVALPSVILIAEIKLVGRCLAYLGLSCLEERYSLAGRFSLVSR